MENGTVVTPAQPDLLDDLFGPEYEDTDEDTERRTAHNCSLARRIHMAMADLGLLQRGEKLIVGETPYGTMLTLRTLSPERADKFARDLEDLAQRAGR